MSAADLLILGEFCVRGEPSAELEPQSITAAAQRGDRRSDARRQLLPPEGCRRCLCRDCDRSDLCVDAERQLTEGGPLSAQNTFKPKLIAMNSHGAASEISACPRFHTRTPSRQRLSQDNGFSGCF